MKKANFLLLKKDFRKLGNSNWITFSSKDDCGLVYPSLIVRDVDILLLSLALI